MIIPYGSFVKDIVCGFSIYNSFESIFFIFVFRFFILIPNFLNVYEEDYKKYSYPSNLNPQQICEFLFKWKEYVPQELVGNYDNLINFFKTGKINKCPMDYNNNNNPFIKQGNLNDFAAKFVNSQYMINTGNKNVKDLYEKSGKYEFIAEIGQPCDNKLRNNIEHAKKVRKGDNNYDPK